MALEVVLGEVAGWRWLYLVAKPSHMAVDVDGLSCPLHHPTACWCQTRAQSSWSGTILLYLVAKLLLREPLPKWAHMLRPPGWGPEPLDRHRFV
jgi:hypothetical protein